MSRKVMICDDISWKSYVMPCNVMICNEKLWYVKHGIECFDNIRSTLHIVSTLYSEHLPIVNNFGETLEWRFILIVSLYSEPLHIVNKILLQIVFTIWRNCISTRQESSMIHAAVSDCRLIWKFWDGRTDYLCEKIVITNRPGLWSASWINFKKLLSKKWKNKKMSNS